MKGRLKNSQLHDKIVMSPTFIEVLHPHDVLVFDSVKITRRFYHDATVKVPQESSHVFRERRKIINATPPHTDC